LQENFIVIQAMNKLFNILMLFCLSQGVQAQEVYSLQRCMELALQNNRQLKVSRMSADVAENTRKAAKTKYLPRVDALAGYQHFSREISLLSDKQKRAFGHLGTNTVGQTGSQMEQNLASLVQQGILSPQTAQQLGQVLGNITTPLIQAGNNAAVSMIRPASGARLINPDRIKDFACLFFGYGFKKQYLIYFFFYTKASRKNFLFSIRKLHQIVKDRVRDPSFSF